MTDVEKAAQLPTTESTLVQESPRTSTSSRYDTLEKFLKMGRVEAQGIQPIPLEERTNTRYWNIFTIWCSINTNILG